MDRARANEYRPDSVSAPGETLQETIAACGMTQADLATRTGRTPKLINEIIKGKAAITTSMALQLERALGVPARFWNNRERRYREALARQDEHHQLEEAVEWLGRFPVNAMVKLGWLRKLGDRVERLRELLDFFGAASPSAWESYWSRVQVSYRTSKAFDADTYALAAWLRKGELEGQATDCLPYDSARFRQVLHDIRGLTREEPGVFQPSLVEACASCGVAVAFVPELPKIRASGATRWLTPSKALVQINLRYKKDDHFWFTVFHEAGHVLYDSKKMVFVDTAEFDGEHEERANRFAEEHLIPQAQLWAFARAHGYPEYYPSKAAIEAFAQHQRIAPGIVVGQLQHHGWLPYTHCNDLKCKFVWANGSE